MECKKSLIYKSRFVNKSSIPKQSEIVHKSEKSANKKLMHECKICGKSFANYSNRKLHYIKHHGSKEEKETALKFRCKFCEKKFYTKYILENHERSHTKERPFSCHLCDATFAQKSTRFRHIKSHEKKENNQFNITMQIVFNQIQ